MSAGLVALIYQAVEDPARWQDFLEAFAQRMNTKTAQFWVSALSPQRVEMRLTRGVGAEVLSIMAGPDYRDPWFSRVDLTTVPAGKILRSNEICPDDEVVHDEWYQRVCLPHGYHYGAGVLLERTGALSAGMSINRERERGPVTEEEMALWQSLIPHLTTAVRLLAKESRLSAERDALMRYFDDLGHGVILASASASVIAANRQAWQFAARSYGIALDGDRLCGVEPESNQLLTETLFRTGGVDPARPVRVHLRQPGGEAALVATILPVRSGSERAISVETPTALVYLTDLRNPAELDGGPLSELYAFTSAEARVACRIASGDTLAQTAVRLKVSRNTIRTHLQRACSKAGVSRQAELAVLVLKVCRPLA